jgi:hypothetical protein
MAVSDAVVNTPLPPLDKQANNGVRHRITPDLDALLKLKEFLLNLQKFFNRICPTSRRLSHGFILPK